MIRDGRIEHEAMLPHAPERVWRALVDLAELAMWLMPTDFAPEVGHLSTFDARPDLGIVTCEVLVADPPRLLRCRWSGVFGETVVSFELTQADSGTLLRLRHGGWAPRHRGQRDGFDRGWHDKLTKDLPALLGGAPDEPVANGPRPVS